MFIPHRSPSPFDAALRFLLTVFSLLLSLGFTFASSLLQPSLHAKGALLHSPWPFELIVGVGDRLTGYRDYDIEGCLGETPFRAVGKGRKEKALLKGNWPRGGVFSFAVNLSYIRRVMKRMPGLLAVFRDGKLKHGLAVLKF